MDSLNTSSSGTRSSESSLKRAVGGGGSSGDGVGSVGVGGGGGGGGGGGNEPLTLEVQKKVLEAFQVFDHEQNKTVDVREIGTIIRSLGRCPSEGELQEILRDMEDPSQMGYIHYQRFLPVITKIIIQQRFEPSGIDEILTAFRVLDQNEEANADGDISPSIIRKVFTEQGEPFTNDELDEMLNAAIDPRTRQVNYKNFAHLLVIDEDI